MRALTFSSVYGQLRGYDRLTIAREVISNQMLSQAAMSDMTRRLFAARVRAALETDPFYAEQVEAFRGALPGRAAPVNPEALPVWTRAMQREWFAAQPQPTGSILNATGGSTGVPMQYYASRESWEWRTLVSDRGYSWAGAQKGMKSLYVWGTAIHPPGLSARVKGGVNHLLQRRIFFDSFQFGSEEKAACCEAINRVKPAAIVGYTGNLVALAVFARENPELLKWKARSIVTAAEGLHPGQRELLTGQLADDVFVSYGSREFMLIGMECSHHCGYHVNSDNLFVEVVDDEGIPLPAGAIGRVLVTDLRNYATPFIRYEIGDMGTMAEDVPCGCGLPFPRLATVDGRSQEVIHLPDGEAMTALFIPHLMKEFGWVDGYQLAQTTPDRVIVRLLCDGRLTPERVSAIERPLRTKVGCDIEIDFEKAEQLERSPSGKMPIVISSVNRTD